MTEKNLTLPVTGMTCANCVATVERNVRKLDGVHEANVNFASETTHADLRRLAAEHGRGRRAHPARPGMTWPEQTVDLAITGMDCVNCAANV